jgi:hypothetical protein
LFCRWRSTPPLTALSGVERQTDQAVGGDDRGEVDLERRNSETLGRGSQVHADQAGIGGKGRQAKVGAPGVVLAPSRAVGAQRARSACLSGVNRGLGDELADLVGAVRVERAFWKDEVAEDAGRHHQPLPRPIGENLAISHGPFPPPRTFPSPTVPCAGLPPG